MASQDGFSIRPATAADAGGILDCLRVAFRFYEKNGFQRSGQVRDFFGMPLIEYIKTLR